MKLDFDVAKLVVTSRGQAADERRAARRALKTAVPDARVRDSGFRGVWVVEGDGEVVELAETVVASCRGKIGHATAVVEEADSDVDDIRDAAVATAVRHVDDGETFSFRINKRGRHGLDAGTPEIERDVGGAILEALQEERGRDVSVDLEEPDVAVVAEVLGFHTSVGIRRRAWGESRSGDGEADQGGGGDDAVGGEEGAGGRDGP